MVFPSLFSLSFSLLLSCFLRPLPPPVLLLFSCSSPPLSALGNHQMGKKEIKPEEVCLHVTFLGKYWALTLFFVDLASSSSYVCVCRLRSREKPWQRKPRLLLLLSRTRRRSSSRESPSRPRNRRCRSYLSLPWHRCLSVFVALTCPYLGSIGKSVLGGCVFL